MTSVLKNIKVTYVSTGHVAKSIDQVVAAVSSSSADCPLIVDLDETLFLRDATQEYLGCIHPRPLGAAFLVSAKLFKRWLWLPPAFRSDDISRTRFLVVAATILFPWTLLLWHRRAKQLAQEYCNTTLAKAIDANPHAQLVVMTRGLDLIVNPLIRHLPLSSVKKDGFQVVSPRFWQWKESGFVGMLEMVSAMLGESAVARSVVITDSEEDIPLLESSETPCLLKWPKAAFVPAMADMYIPLFYSEKVKNPGQAHFVKRVISSHWVFGVIAWSVLSPHPIPNALGLFLLTLSYWCVYEIGYQENDAVGEKYEDEPTLSTTYDQYKSRINLNTPWPWCWAIAIAIPGLLLMVLSQESTSLVEAFRHIGEPTSILTWAATGKTIALDFAAWLVYLVAIRATFWVYNQANETSRMWIYPFLQVQRLFGFALFASTSVVGSMLLISFVIARWMQYCVYRCGGDRSSFPVNVSCLLLFSMLYAAFAVGTTDVMSLMTGQAAIAFTYCLLRTVKKLTQIKTDLGWITEA